MATGLIEIIKVAAMDAIENGNPADLKFGTVTSVNPLKVMINNNFILPESLLIVPQYLTDYSVTTNVGTNESTKSGASVSMSVEGENLIINTNVVTDDNGDADQLDLVDERTLTVYNSLNEGDNVVLLRNQGGSSYLILDRI